MKWTKQQLNNLFFFVGVLACVVTGGLAVVGKDQVSILTDRVEEAK